MSSRLTCYPCALAAQVAVCKKEEQKGDGVKWHHLQNGFLTPRGATVRSNTPKEDPLAAGKSSMYPGWLYAKIPAGTMRFSFSGVVWPVASRQRSMARCLPMATIAFFFWPEGVFLFNNISLHLATGG